MKTPFELFYIECGKGWYPLIRELHTKLLKIDPDMTVLQIKEKFAGLRFYAAFSDKCQDSEAANKLIYEAEKKSFTICETCGEPGEVRKLGWIKTLCDKHYRETRERIGR